MRLSNLLPAATTRRGMCLALLFVLATPMEHAFANLPGQSPEQTASALYSDVLGQHDQADPADMTTQAAPPAAVPEPATFALLGLGTGLLGIISRRLSPSRPKG